LYSCPSLGRTNLAALHGSAASTDRAPSPRRSVQRAHPRASLTSHDSAALAPGHVGTSATFTRKLPPAGYTSNDALCRLTHTHTRSRTGSGGLDPLRWRPMGLCLGLKCQSTDERTAARAAVRGALGTAIVPAAILRVQRAILRASHAASGRQECIWPP
jgi:hypothetical protein